MDARTKFTDNKTPQDEILSIVMELRQKFTTSDFNKFKNEFDSKVSAVILGIRILHDRINALDRRLTMIEGALPQANCHKEQKRQQLLKTNISTVGIPGSSNGVTLDSKDAIFRAFEIGRNGDDTLAVYHIMGSLSNISSVIVPIEHFHRIQHFNLKASNSKIAFVLEDVVARSDINQKVLKYERKIILFHGNYFPAFSDFFLKKLNIFFSGFFWKLFFLETVCSGNCLFWIGSFLDLYLWKY